MIKIRLGFLGEFIEHTFHFMFCPEITIKHQVTVASIDLNKKLLKPIFAIVKAQFFGFCRLSG
jgi:hypothetical protein